MTLAQRLDTQQMLSNAFWRVTTVHDLAWAAGQFLMHNSDATINDLELESRVASLLTVNRENLDRLKADWDEAGVK